MKCRCIFVSTITAKEIMTTIEILKANRNFVIAKLKYEFCIKNVEIGTLMKDFVEYLNNDTTFTTECFLSAKNQKSLEFKLNNAIEWFKTECDETERYDTDYVGIQDYNNARIKAHNKMVLS